MKKSNPPSCEVCMVELETLYLNDGTAKFIRCPRCKKVYVDKKEKDSDV